MAFSLRIGPTLCTDISLLLSHPNYTGLVCNRVREKRSAVIICVKILFIVYLYITNVYVHLV